MSEMPPPVVAAVPGRPACRFCGAQLDPHQAARGAVCAAPRCQMQRVQQASRAVFQRDWDSYVDNQRKAAELSGPQIARAAQMLGADTEKLVIGVVPHQDRALVPLPAERRAAFEARLDGIIAAAFAEPLPEDDLAQRVREEAAEHPLIGATCGMCQGKCCSLGGPQMAFLNPSDIQRFRIRHPGAIPDGVRGHYLGRMPERSVEFACVFQGARGCTLDRADRADICNRYHCNPQTQLLKRLTEAGARQAVIVANEGEAGPVVAAFDIDEGVRRVADGIGDGAAEIVGPGAPDLRAAMAALDAALAQMPPPLPAAGPVQAPGCDYCGAPLTPHQRVSTRCCGAPACEQRRLEATARLTAERVESRFAALREKVATAAETGLAEAAAVLGTPRESMLVGVVPFQNRPAVPLPPERRADFAAHLGAIIAEGFAEPVVEVNLAARDLLDATEQPLAGAGCATCQGSCCTLGGRQNAFLGVDQIHLHRQRHPEATPGQIRDFYLGRLPERSVEGSCVFHAAAGCTLPRDRRAYICNAFLCKGLVTLAKDWQARDARAAAIVAHLEAEPRAVAVYDEEGGWQPVQRPDPPDES